MKTVAVISLLLAFAINAADNPCALAGEGARVRDMSGKTLIGDAGAKDVPALIGFLGSEDGYLRAQARYALVSIGKDAVPGLIAALGQRKNVAELAYVINSIKDERAAGPLAELLDLKDDEERAKVESALFSFGAAAVPYLFDAMRDKARCESAARVLSSLKDPESFGSLQDCLKAKDPQVRACAAKVELAWLDIGAARIMGGLLQDGSPEVREHASGYFLALSRDLDAPHMEGLLKDTDALVRRNAVNIIIRKKEPGHFDSLVFLLEKDPDDVVRKLSSDALFRCCADKAVAPLIGALRDKSEDVAASAAGRLGGLKAGEALPFLSTLLAERGKPSDVLVEGVAAALADIGGPYDPNLLLPYINWENLYVVRSVLRAWEGSARPEDTKIKEALKRYLLMPVDNRYKNRVRDLLEKLG